MAKLVDVTIRINVGASAYPERLPPVEAVFAPIIADFEKQLRRVDETAEMTTEDWEALKRRVLSLGDNGA